MNRLKNEWIKDIDIEKHLEGDLLMIYEICGLDTLMVLMENLSKITIYISEKPLVSAKKEYIKKNFNGHNAKELAIKLRVSEKFVTETIHATRKKSKHPEPSFFD